MHHDSHVITNDTTTKPFVTEPMHLSTQPVALWALVHSCLFAPAANAHPATQHSVGALHMDICAIPLPICRPLATPGLSLTPSLSLNRVLQSRKPRCFGRCFGNQFQFVECQNQPQNHNLILPRFRH